MSLDEKSTTALIQIYPDIRVRIRRVEEDMLSFFRVQIRITETVRTLERQAEIYAKGRRFRPAGAPSDGSLDLAMGILPMEKVSGVWILADKKLVISNSPPGTSMHHFGLAVDCCLVSVDGKPCHPFLDKDPRAGQVWKDFGRIAQGHGLQWGGDWNGNGIHDANDFDRPHVQLCYGYRLQELLELLNYGGIPAVWRAIDKHRGVPEGQNWLDRQPSLA